MKTVTVSGPVKDVRLCNTAPFVLICGPCQIESRDHAFACAETLLAHTSKAGIPMIFKASYDKANRSSGAAKRGIGIDAGLKILAEIRSGLGVPVLTDVHEVADCGPVAEIVDILQIPAFLCRQTDLLLAAAATRKPVNIKKGQFLAPWDMQHVAAKIADAGNEQVVLTERGTSFGYNNLVSDFRSIPLMAETGYPVVFDATHSAQQPGGLGKSSGGERRFVPVLARAALAVGVAGLFIEAHDEPDNAPSDGPNMLRLDALPGLFEKWLKLDEIAKFR